jgi:hypothetical protein
MQGSGRVQEIHGFTFQPPESTYMLATMQLKAPKSHRNYSFSLDATTPPATDIHTIMQRGDEVNAVLHMLTDLQTSTVVLSGDAGAGKSTLAALLYRRLELTSQAGLPAPRHYLEGGSLSTHVPEYETIGVGFSQRATARVAPPFRGCLNCS